MEGWQMFVIGCMVLAGLIHLVTIGICIRIAIEDRRWRRERKEWLRA